MSLSDHILQIWASSPYNPPQVPLIYHEDEYMITVDDSDVFLRFMSPDGQIFMALSNKCQLGQPTADIGDQVYMCDKLDPILCAPVPGPKSGRDFFVMNNIAPLLQ